MSVPDAPALVVKTVTVACDPEQAFRLFTAFFHEWWPTATHSCIAFASGHTEKPAFVTFGCCPAGLIVEHGRSGERHIWGTILRWEPPSRVEFSWHPGRPPDTAQRVQVTFDAVPDGTRVTLEHSDWQRLGADAATVRSTYDRGWEQVFVTGFAGFASRHIRSS